MTRWRRAGALALASLAAFALIAGAFRLEGLSPFYGRGLPLGLLGGIGAMLIYATARLTAPPGRNRVGASGLLAAFLVAGFPLGWLGWWFVRVARTSILLAVTGNLSQLEFCLRQFRLEHPEVAVVRYDDLVGPNRYLRTIATIADEDYRTLFPRREPHLACVLDVPRCGAAVVFGREAADAPPLYVLIDGRGRILTGSRW